MRVLHFYKTYLPDTMGGVEQVIYQLAHSSAKLGITTEVLCLSKEKVDRKINIDHHEVYRCATNIEIASTPLSISAFLRFKQRVAKADIIHYHFPYPFTDVLHYLTRVKKPTIVTYHSDIIKQKNLLKLYMPLMNKFLSDVNHIVATSPNYLHSSNVLKHHKNKTSIIPIGLNKDSYPKLNRDKLKYWEDELGKAFFLFVGVLRYYKGLHILIEASKNASYDIVIVGAGPIEKELKSQVTKLGITNVHFLGFVDDEDKVALYHLCYAVVFPSHLRSEAFGVSLLEGAMYGKPLISSEIGTGTSYINIHDQTGLVVQAGNPFALRQAMDYLWNNTAVASKMGELAHERFLELFTAEKMAQSYFDLYKKILEK